MIQTRLVSANLNMKQSYSVCDEAAPPPPPVPGEEGRLRGATDRQPLLSLSSHPSMSSAAPSSRCNVKSSLASLLKTQHRETEREEEELLLHPERMHVATHTHTDFIPLLRTINSAPGVLHLDERAQLRLSSPPSDQTPGTSTAADQLTNQTVKTQRFI